MVYYYIICDFKSYITGDIVYDFKIFPSKILKHLIFLSDFQNCLCKEKEARVPDSNWAKQTPPEIKMS